MFVVDPRDTSEMAAAMRRRNEAAKAVAKARTAEEFEATVAELRAAEAAHGALLLARDKAARPHIYRRED